MKKGVTEQDDTHFAEVVGLHNIGKDNGVQTKEQLIERTNNNFENRCVHHHVFDFALIKQMLEYTSFSVEMQQWVAPFHLVSIAKKTG